MSAFGPWSAACSLQCVQRLQCPVQKKDFCFFFFMKIEGLTWRWSFYWRQNKSVCQGDWCSHWGINLPLCREKHSFCNSVKAFHSKLKIISWIFELFVCPLMNEHFSVLHCTEMTESTQKMLVLFTNRKLSLQVFILTQWVIDLLYPRPRCCHLFWIKLKTYEGNIAN